MAVPEEHPVPLVLMDAREPADINAWLEREGIVVERKQLDVGDYVLSQDVVVERKCGADLTASIMDNRLFEQVLRLVESFPSPVLVLEGIDAAFTSSNMNPASIYGALGYIALRFHIPVIPTRDWRDTALLLKRLVIRVQVRDEDPLLARHVPKLLTLEERKAFILEGLVNVGPKTSMKLIEVFKHPLAVFKAIDESTVTYTKGGNPKGIDGPLGGIKGIGPKFLLENKKLVGDGGSEGPGGTPGEPVT